MDCDVVVLEDVQKLFTLGRLNPRYAVMCVKHCYTPAETTKMDGQPQRVYQRKNWSSVMLWNCEHPAHNRLTLPLINEWPRRFLHRFVWLEDEDIGELPAEWNWLVNVQPKPAAPKIAHYTLGGPWLPSWRGAENDELWLKHRELTRRERCLQPGC